MIAKMQANPTMKGITTPRIAIRSPRFSQRSGTYSPRQFLAAGIANRDAFQALYRLSAGSRKAELMNMPSAVVNMTHHTILGAL